MARVAVLAVGSRGDVEPPLALARALRAAGHDVVVGAPRGYDDLAARAGVAPPVHLGPDPRELLASGAGRAWLESPRGRPDLFVRRFLELARPWWAEHESGVRRACGGADVVVWTTLAFAGWHVAEAMGVPAVAVSLSPSWPTRELPPVLGGELPAPWPPPLRAASRAIAHRAPDALAWWAVRRSVNRWRREQLGLPALGPGRLPRASERRGEQHLVAVSPALVPRPADWPAAVHLTGHWRLPAPSGAALPAEVERFLDDGPAPVYVGLGSLRREEPARVRAAVLGAARAAGVRVVLGGGWGGLGAHDELRDLPRGACAVADVPHDLLLPRCAGALTHGGAGTTHAAVRSGRPSAALPVFADQPFWGARTAALGLGPEPLPLAGALGPGGVDRLASRLAALAGPAHEARAAAVSERLRGERGGGAGRRRRRAGARGPLAGPRRSACRDQRQASSRGVEAA